MAGQDLVALVEAIHRIWEGERDETALTKGLNEEETKIIHGILQGVANPETLVPLTDVLKETMEIGEES